MRWQTHACALAGAEGGYSRLATRGRITGLLDGTERHLAGTYAVAVSGIGCISVWTAGWEVRGLPAYWPEAGRRHT
jgi:hypothetical protein